MAKKTPADEVRDDALTQAAADAVSDEVQKEEIKEEISEIEEQIEQKVEKKEEILPTEHEERSKLGRTLAALHRRLDEFDGRDAQRQEQMDRLIEALEKQQEPENEYDPDMPMTRAELERTLEEREARKKQEEAKLTQKYQTGYSTKWAELSKDLTEAEYDDILAEAQVMKYDPSNNPAVDAELNFKEAQLRVFKKQLTKKTTPLRDNKVADNIGVVTSQKTVDKEGVLPKLDPAAQSYLNFVSREDGAEKATNLHKALK